MSTPPTRPAGHSHFLSLPDLAARSAGGAVLWANDDVFAEKENLIKPGAPEYQPATFGHKGQIYDGWETRRRRGATSDSHDCAIVRLGVPGIIRGVVVDTAWFTGNYPPEISVEAAFVEGYPTPEELAHDVQWTTIVERRAVNGDTRNPFAVESPRRWTHVRLAIYPDGGVARLRVHGEGLLDPRFTELPLDLAALENGGRITACSNMFYSSPNNLLLPGAARTMGEGWETSRRRDAGNDWVQVRLAGQGVLAAAELDTSYFIGNAPGSARLRGRDGDGEWFDLVPLTDLQPDTKHRFLIEPSTGSAHPVTEVRLDIHPDGGMARLRLFGRLTSEGLRRLTERWEASA